MNSPPARPEHQKASQRIAGGIQKQNPNYVRIVNSYANRKAVVCRRVATHLIKEGRAEWVAADQIKLNDHPVNASRPKVMRSPAGSMLASPEELLIGKHANPVFSFPTGMQTSADRHDRQRRLEAAARATIERRADRKLTDAEWTVLRARLLEFMGILRGWEQTATRPRRGSVEVLCQREP